VDDGEAVELRRKARDGRLDRIELDPLGLEERPGNRRRGGPAGGAEGRSEQLRLLASRAREVGAQFGASLLDLAAEPLRARPRPSVRPRIAGASAPARGRDRGHRRGAEGQSEQAS
jgi:hypothetical protein